MKTHLLLMTNTKTFRIQLKKIFKISILPEHLLIKNKVKNTNTFHFEQVMLSKMRWKVWTKGLLKPTTHNIVPPKMLWKSAEVTAKLKIQISWCYASFQEDTWEKMNYRLVSVLPPVSKIFEKLRQKQINEQIKNKLFPYLFVYLKIFGTQYALLSLIER